MNKHKNARLLGHSRELLVCHIVEYGLSTRKMAYTRCQLYFGIQTKKGVGNDCLTIARLAQTELGACARDGLRVFVDGFED